MGEVIAFHPHLSPIATALADEGVPIRVISRAMRVPSEDMRTHLHEAKDRGELIELPAEDWPPTAKRQDRIPQPSAADLATIALNARSVFKITAQQAAVFATLLTRNEAKKEQLLAAVQHQRTSKSSLPNDMEEPQLKLIDVVVCNLRKRIKPHGITIETMWGSGYQISRANRELALRLISDYVTAAVTTEKTDADPQLEEFEERKAA
jgi:hypothetical protein